MKLSTISIALILLGATAFATVRPVVEAPRDVVIEGYIESTMLDTTTTRAVTGTIVVEGVRVFVGAHTVLKDVTGSFKSDVLRVGMKVTVFGYESKGAVTARVVYIYG